ncbi:MAG: response regulator transcription factor [Anaerolineales bacterium]|jgi:DNA-binding response OmpR family regulator|nr:response regulator transcription factor [Anaerolineales bacterium]
MPKTILVLEDEEMLYQLVHDLLHFEGYQVHRLTDFNNLSGELRANPADAIVADVNLRGANGMELVEALRRQPDFNNVYVLLTSGIDYGEEALQRGADDFLQKPYMPDELVNLLASRLAEGS